MNTLLPFFREIAAFSKDTYFVGGCLRQFFLGQPIHDYDFVCKTSAIQLARHLSQHFQVPYFVLDAERDIARVVISEQDTLDFACFQGDDITSDLVLRDLTINAMAYPVEAFSTESLFERADLIDPLNGYQDLISGTIRGISESNFQSDALRLLRVFRFAVQHRFRIENTTLQWVEHNAMLLQQSASERILSELEKILKVPQTDGLNIMESTGLLQQVFPLDATDLQDNLQDLMVLNTELMALPTDGLDFCLTGERNLRVLMRLFVLGFAQYFKKMSSEQCLVLTGKQIMSTQKQRMPIIAAMSSSEWSFFQKISTSMLLLSCGKCGSPVEMSRFFRQVLDTFPSVYILGKVLYRDDNTLLNSLDTLSTLWTDAGNPVAHPRVFLSGHEVAQIGKEKPGPKIGQWLDQLLDAQATGEVTDKASAVTFLTRLSANNV